MSKLAENRKVRFDFEILDTFEAGVVLTGHEVKSIRTGKANLEGAHVVVRGGEAYLVGAHIAPYQMANTPKDYEPERARKLLLTQEELKELEAQGEKKGLTIVPISLYNKSRNIKLEVAIARGKKKTDKRNVIKDRETKRDIERTLKNQYR